MTLTTEAYTALIERIEALERRVYDLERIVEEENEENQQ